MCENHHQTAIADHEADPRAARALAVTRESVARALAALRREGVLEQGRGRVRLAGLLASLLERAVEEKPLLLLGRGRMLYGMPVGPGRRR
ncbi:MAG TPA: hypothetical protein VFS05_01325 [Gemmatimonadaceae bacterium]|nr:hypothetical protein [Gemmatimonadaceae bacterium]